MKGKTLKQEELQPHTVQTQQLYKNCTFVRSEKQLRDHKSTTIYRMCCPCMKGNNGVIGNVPRDKTRRGVVGEGSVIGRWLRYIWPTLKSFMIFNYTTSHKHRLNIARGMFLQWQGRSREKKGDFFPGYSARIDVVTYNPVIIIVSNISFQFGISRDRYLFYFLLFFKIDNYHSPNKPVILSGERPSAVSVVQYHQQCVSWVQHLFSGFWNYAMQILQG